MNVHDDDFALFGLARQFVQDPAQIDDRWKALQRQVHPDKFAAQGAAAQRQAMQWSVRINEAYQRLRNPLKRAAYLCELKGAPIQAENNTAMPAHFLMQQMEWREALEEASTSQAIQALEDEVSSARKQALAACGRLLDETQDYPGAAQQVRALMFIERFRDDINARLDQLGQ